MRLRALLLVAPFVTLPWCSDWLAQREASQLALGLSLLSEGTSPSERGLRDADRDEVALWRAQLASLWDESGRDLIRSDEAGPTEAGTGAAGAARQGRGVFVSADKVLQLAEQGVRPGGIPVSSSGKRPGGLMLVGVGSLGIGLREGDILTEALGRPAVSEAAVVGAIIRARGARQSHLSGRVWRDGRTFPLVVAQPYLEAH